MSATVSTWFNVSVIDSSRDATIDVKYGTQYLPVFSYSSDPVSKWVSEWDITLDAL